MSSIPPVEAGRGRAAERVGAVTTDSVVTLELGGERFDVVLAGAVLHHLRGEAEWRAVFAKLYAELHDLVFAEIAEQDTPRPLLFRLDLLRSVGFAGVEVLHETACFATFGAVRRAAAPG